MWLLAGPRKCNWPIVIFWSVFQNPVTYTLAHMPIAVQLRKSLKCGNTEAVNNSELYMKFWRGKAVCVLVCMRTCVVCFGVMHLIF